jgi:hypothetical protein
VNNPLLVCFPHQNQDPTPPIDSSSNILSKYCICCSYERPRLIDGSSITLTDRVKQTVLYSFNLSLCVTSLNIWVRAKPCLHLSENSSPVQLIASPCEAIKHQAVIVHIMYAKPQMGGGLWVCICVWQTTLRG